MYIGWTEAFPRIWVTPKPVVLIPYITDQPFGTAIAVFCVPPPYSFPAFRYFGITKLLALATIASFGYHRLVENSEQLRGF